ncbi:Predicted flavoprotein CzcO associated with the cation diffusion facilitator CzcD [Reichenbachiella agariperforans]|uniref:Predicted flavoprotein CzcO associated with the cation diffusion facilitator CzcD n=1 Tax=Reichenbachiella agariperforans TaxID=156994 RepID=A0A1M6RCK2_REIAG|nr:NAD(P)-binding domain-containing protein [Reichenbachiella agariperforans]SHK30172.1 Predicted flavoprotein CzcO associated with the cation diffusion facilitator CzcD [Reichenbachiella agariperforans]
MQNNSLKSQHIAIIGAGVSGISAARVWQKCGYSVTIYEASDQIGGQWNMTYPGVRLQNTAPQYQFSDFPWPFTPDRHPTGEQVLKYMHAAVAAYGIEVKLNHKVTQMVKQDIGWQLTFENGTQGNFAYVMIATGQYPGGDKKHKPRFENIDSYRGEVVTNINSKEVFKDKHVAVVGFGKTALDFAAWSGAVAQSTQHIFRTPRWTIPDHLLGIDYTRPFFSRFGSDMMPSWCHSSLIQNLLHKKLTFVVKSFWGFIATLFQYQHRKDAKLGTLDPSVLDLVFPPKSQFVPDLRSASAVAPNHYYEYVAHQRIIPYRGEVASFFEHGLILSDGQKIEADMVCICCGNEAPTYGFLPETYAQYLRVHGGPSLYRHQIDPRIPDLGFAGYNHGFMHIALCEMGTLWQIAAHQKDLQLPSETEMLASAQRVSQWKIAHSSYESTFNIAVSTRYQQHLDILLQDLGISQWRKLPNVPAEIFARYDPTDYKGVVEEYLAKSAKRKAKGQVKHVMPVDA